MYCDINTQWDEESMTSSIYMYDVWYAQQGWKVKLKNKYNYPTPIQHHISLFIFNVYFGFLVFTQNEVLLAQEAASATQRADLESHLRTAQNALEDKQKELRNLNELKCEKGILNRREVWLRFGLIERGSSNALYGVTWKLHGILSRMSRKNLNMTESMEKV